MMPGYIKKTKKAFPNLTRGLKRVADYVLSEPMVFAIHPAQKVGEIIGVSQTMIIRFCNEIGYNGYTPFQKEVRSHLLDPSGNVLNNADGIQSSRYVESVTKDLNTMQYSIQHVDKNTLDYIVQTILNCDKILIGGYYHSFTFAHWFYFNLNYIMGNAELYRPETDAGLLDLLPEKSCVLVFSFYRYALDTIRLAEEAKNKGITVIAVTDSSVSPIVNVADKTLSLNLADKAIIDKGPVTLSILNAILKEVVGLVDSKATIRKTFKYYVRDGEDNE